MQPSDSAALPRPVGVSVVIPCLNEEESLVRVIEAAKAGIAKVASEGEVIVVDNGSTDRSVAVAEEHGARVLHEPQRGYGSALRRGFDSARFDVVVMGDADQTYDFSALDELVRPILAGEADFVVGNRMRNIKPGSMPRLHRYIGNPVLSLLLRLMFHTNAIRDAHCGMRAIRRDAYRRLQCVTTGMEFASEMVVRAIHCGLRMQERDIVYHPRVGESKLMSFRDGWRHLRFMLLHSPTSALLIPGGVAWTVGLLIALPLAFGPVMVNGRAIDIHCMIAGGLLNVVSIQLITLGLLAKAYAHLSGLRRDPLISWLYNMFTFEKAMLIALPLLLAGVITTLWVITGWIASGFGPLNQIRILFLGMLCLVNGVQIGAAGYLFSIMALPRHLDRVPPELAGTAIPDRPAN